MAVLKGGAVSYERGTPVQVLDPGIGFAKVCLCPIRVPCHTIPTLNPKP